MKRCLPYLMALALAAPAPAAGLYPALTLAHPGVLPLGPRDQAWEDDPSALAEAPAWDLRAGLEGFDAAWGEAYYLSGAKGLGDEGGYGLRYAQATDAPPAAAQGGQASVLGGGFGWPLGYGVSGGLSLWQASGDVSQASLVGVGLRWAMAEHLLSVNGLWSKDGAARPVRAGLEGPLGGAWCYGAVVDADGAGLQSAQALLGWGPVRVFQRYSEGRHSSWAGLVWEGPSWGLQALAGYGVEDQWMGRLALTLSSIHGDAGVDQKSPQFTLGWRSWEATPPALTQDVPDNN